MDHLFRTNGISVVFSAATSNPIEKQFFRVLLQRRLRLSLVSADVAVSLTPLATFVQLARRLESLGGVALLWKMRVPACAPRRAKLVLLACEVAKRTLSCVFAKAFATFFWSRCPVEFQIVCFRRLMRSCVTTAIQGWVERTCVRF